MKTPWSTLLQYGAGIATMVVIVSASMILLLVVGAAVMVTKFSEYIK